MKPFLKWVGGKTQILDSVLELFPNEVQNYYEPFVGGGSVLLAFLEAVQSKRILCKGTVYASDLNTNLISLYVNIQSNCEDVITELENLTGPFSACSGTIVNRDAKTLEDAQTSQESYYYWIRYRFNTLPKEERSTPLASAMMLFLNKTCFRGVYREGPHGFNVPFGHYKNPTVLDADHLRAVSDLIKDVVFTCQSFVESLVDLNENDFVYLDPPYAPESSKSFVGYTADGFDINDHTSLFKICNEMTCRFLMSNANVQLVRDSFPEERYEVKIISCRRAIHSKNPETRTNEVLIRNLQTS
jgi:DNA adenine methylase